MSFLADLLFPRSCLVCGRLGEYFCSQHLLIRDKMPRLVCPYCGKPAVFGQTHAGCRRERGLDGLIALFPYREPVPKAIKTLKYRGVTDLVEELVEQCLVQVRSQGQRLKLNPGWTLVPVPLHKSRLNERGFNQASLVGERLAGGLRLEFTDVLGRTKKTKPQSDLDSAEARFRNIRGVFNLKEQPNFEQVYLFDDVWTSGSTLKECARVLKQAGVSQVWGLVLAR